MPSIKPTRSPNLPISPRSYAADHFDILNNVLRLYFERIEGVFRTLFGTNGGVYLSMPHISASDSTDQYAGGDNTPTKVAWDTLGSASGFTLNLDGSATANYSGIYKIDYSLQFVNTDNAAHDIYIWLHVDGTDVANSASNFTIPARKSVGVSAYLIAYSSVTFQIVAGEAVTLYWAVDKAYNTVGPVDGVYMEALAAKTAPPYAAPASPSAVGSIVFVSGVPT